MDPATTNPKHLWPNARSALEFALASSVTFGEAVSSTARRLHITGPLAFASAREIAALADELTDPEAFARFRDVCMLNAVYVTALTRMHRTQRRRTQQTPDKETTP